MKWVFWIAAATIVYAYVGYAAWLWFRSRWAPRPVRRGTLQPPVSAVLVVRNEETVIARKLQNLLALDYPPEKMQVVVVSDGSTDSTPAILSEFGSTPRVKTLLKPESQGKALGLNDAIKLACGEILLFTDARQTIEPAALRLLIENFADPAVGCVSGELMLGDPADGETEKGMGLYWRIEKDSRTGVGVWLGTRRNRRALLRPPRNARTLARRNHPRRCAPSDAAPQKRRAYCFRFPRPRLGLARLGREPRIFAKSTHPQRQLSAAATGSVAADFQEPDSLRVHQPQDFAADRTFRIAGASDFFVPCSATVVSHRTACTTRILRVESGSDVRPPDRPFNAGSGRGPHICRAELRRFHGLF